MTHRPASRTCVNAWILTSYSPFKFTVLSDHLHLVPKPFYSVTRNSRNFNSLFVLYRFTPKGHRVGEFYFYSIKFNWTVLKNVLNTYMYFMLKWLLLLYLSNDYLSNNQPYTLTNRQIEFFYVIIIIIGNETFTSLQCRIERLGVKDMSQR